MKLNIYKKSLSFKNCVNVAEIVQIFKFPSEISVFEQSVSSSIKAYMRGLGKYDSPLHHGNYGKLFTV